MFFYRSYFILFFFFSSRRRHTRWTGDWSSDVCSSDLGNAHALALKADGKVVGWGNNTYSQITIPASLSNAVAIADRKSTRLNSSHPSISYAVFCLKKKINFIMPLSNTLHKSINLIQIH